MFIDFDLVRVKSQTRDSGTCRCSNLFARARVQRLCGKIEGGTCKERTENGKRIGKTLIRISTELDVTSCGNCSSPGVRMSECI